MKNSKDQISILIEELEERIAPATVWTITHTGTAIQRANSAGGPSITVDTTTGTVTRV